MTRSAVRLSKIEKGYGASQVLRNIDLTVEAGEFMTLVGPSGCGKSTLLKILAGLDQPDAGSIEIGGELANRLRPSQRDIAMVFQSYALYPHMRVRDNLAMPLIMANLPFVARMPVIGHLVPGMSARRRQIGSTIGEVAKSLGIEALLERKPSELSGGQRQRVALGRAMVRQPGVFLMDEPLSNLDAALRTQVRTELVELQRRLNATFLYVTHDQVEAMTMSGRIAVMMDGALVQVATPAEIYAAPADIRVARFIGSPPINHPTSPDRGTGRHSPVWRKPETADRLDAGRANSNRHTPGRCGCCRSDPTAWRVFSKARAHTSDREPRKRGHHSPYTHWRRPGSSDGAAAAAGLGGGSRERRRS